MDRKLAGKNVLITGASRGLGRAIAEHMWREGANLLLVSRTGTQWNEPGAPDQTARCFAADLAGSDAPEQIMGEARRLWQRLDVLVNNAAMSGPLGPFADSPPDLWRLTLSVNLLAPVELCRLAVPWMREGGGGCVINISGGGATSPLPNFSAYGTSKAALVRFSETLAIEVASGGIRVHCVAPGVMKTALLDNVLAAGPERIGAIEHGRLTAQAASGALSTEPGARLCVFLASKESEGISGKLISAVWDPWENLSRHVEDLRSTDIYTLRRILPEDRGKQF